MFTYTDSTVNEKLNKGAFQVDKKSVLKIICTASWLEHKLVI